MKSFIKDKLRLVLEGRLGRHTSSNSSSAPDGNKNKTPGLKGTEEDFRYEMTVMDNLYRNNQDAFLPKDGEGMYQFKMTNLGKGNFNLVGTGNRIGTKAVAGMDNDSQGGGARYFSVPANNDIQPEDYIKYKKIKNANKDGAEGKEYFITPMDMAYAKLMSTMSDRVKAFMDTSGYDDGKGHNIGAEKMTDFEARKKDKKDIENKLGKPMNSFEWERYKESGQLPDKVDKKISISSDAATLTAEKQRLLALWKDDRRNQDLRKQIKQIEKLEKQINK